MVRSLIFPVAHFRCLFEYAHLPDPTYNSTYVQYRRNLLYVAFPKETSILFSFRVRVSLAAMKVRGSIYGVQKSGEPLDISKKKKRKL